MERKSREKETTNSAERAKIAAYLVLLWTLLLYLLSQPSGGIETAQAYPAQPPTPHSSEAAPRTPTPWPTATPHLVRDDDIVRSCEYDLPIYRSFVLLEDVPIVVRGLISGKELAIDLDFIPEMDEEVFRVLEIDPLTDEAEIVVWTFFPPTGQAGSLSFQYNGVSYRVSILRLCKDAKWLLQPTTGRTWEVTPTPPPLPPGIPVRLEAPPTPRF
ncbi:MAG: hypothetical protein UX31_C0003G0015 [Candidatus Nomurabacteria bacterium GW2011_GWA1_46_11]|uniref:Uncharacterized protein n=1 Tax=Candidatus Nomurabacteria bacterium GW2011_GWA1_46_11 TaxID=1618732 RepID=A0A0G1NNW9_9BACT|nr:MAG: hypothetical protein UW69_C0039G0005 [Microgenomates group bacterium GW2011_GWA2_44_7]KKT78291.1 MAG: hypothetical protein UW73_C0004G0015 [Microgenomates group bacterium GW2011_GWB1_44_8]KKU22349.1 MAG: hypothetical protein UX31_C0003G0015 [Candidatus Nomurabacteria bacterium GW2011_GWA1_46_11]